MKKMLKDSVEIKNTDSFKNTYVCDWCSFEFVLEVRTFQKVTTQVVCPRCNNFLKTWW